MAVLDASILKESRDRYLTYALSVVSGRALPDVRDGLKPVQRRILYAMFKNLHLKPTASHLKSAKIVGEVLGNYHPHGDSACYEAMVRMAQDFSLRYPLVDGQGNFGSLDGDSAAAYRYTEAKLTELALEVVGEIEEETVDFRDNFDGTREEPVVFPSRVPNLLINGASGIAVGMATSIPPHNLKEVIKAVLLVASEPDVSNAKLVTQLKGPDFPTGCAILNTKKELDEMYATGRGSVRMRGTWKTEDLERGKKAIIIDSIPYTVNKAQLVEKIAGLIIDRKLPQLQDIRDESTDDIRIVLELSSGANADLAMAYLFKNTALESNFSMNLTVLVPTASGNLKPENLPLKSCLEHFLEFRKEVVAKRLAFEKKNLLARIHILEGLVKIFDALDEAIKIVRKSDGRTDAATKLKARFKLTDIQSFAIVDLRIYQLSKTNIDEIRAELNLKEKRVKEIDKILASKKAILEIITKELEQIAEKYGDKRKSTIMKDDDAVEFDESHYIVNEDVYAIVTADGWIKRIRQNNELTATRLRDGDRILRAHPLSTKDSVVFFTNLGTMYSLSVMDFPSSSGYGDPIQKILKFKDGESIVESYGVKSPTSPAQSEIPLMDNYPHLIKEKDKILLVSSKGLGFATSVEGTVGLKKSGKRVMNLKGNDKLVAAVFPQKEIAMFTEQGSGLSIPNTEVAFREGSAVGIQLMGVRSDDQLVSVVPHNGKGKLIVSMDSDKNKEIQVSEVVKGKRALKGNKVIARGRIVKVVSE